MVRFLIPVHALANDQQGQLLDCIPVSASSDKNRRILYKKAKNTMLKLLSGGERVDHPVTGWWIVDSSMFE